MTPSEWNAKYPVGTKVYYRPGFHTDPGRPSWTRTPAWYVGVTPCVSVEGYPGGIALTHIEVAP